MRAKIINKSNDPNYDLQRFSQFLLLENLVWGLKRGPQQRQVICRLCTWGGAPARHPQPHRHLPCAVRQQSTRPCPGPGGYHRLQTPGLPELLLGVVAGLPPHRGHPARLSDELSKCRLYIVEHRVKRRDKIDVLLKTEGIKIDLGGPFPQ